MHPRVRHWHLPWFQFHFPSSVKRTVKALTITRRRATPVVICSAGGFIAVHLVEKLAEVIALQHRFHFFGKRYCFNSCPRR